MDQSVPGSQLLIGEGKFPKTRSENFFFDSRISRVFKAEASHTFKQNRYL